MNRIVVIEIVVDRVTQVLQVQANLVRPTRDWETLHQRTVQRGRVVQRDHVRARRLFVTEPNRSHFSLLLRTLHD